jgi:Tfp pilus assembly protein PilF
VRIERKLGDRITENNYAMQLRKNFPDARETQLMLYKQ